MYYKKIFAIVSPMNSCSPASGAGFRPSRFVLLKLRKNLFYHRIAVDEYISLHKG